MFVFLFIFKKNFERFIGKFSKRFIQNFFIYSSSPGQAAFESVLVIPFLFLIFCFITLGFHHLGSSYLFDHWTYQSAFCLAREKEFSFCRNQLKKRLGFIPFSQFSINEFYKSEKQIRVELSVNTPFFSDKKIFEELRLPIKISDLKKAQ